MVMCAIHGAHPSGVLRTSHFDPVEMVKSDVQEAQVPLERPLTPTKYRLSYLTSFQTSICKVDKQRILHES
jgi:hypothetical protein